MRPGPSAFVRPDCDQKCAAPAMHGGPCGTCKMGTNPGRTHRFYTGKAVIPFVSTQQSPLSLDFQGHL